MFQIYFDKNKNHDMHLKEVEDDSIKCKKDISGNLYLISRNNLQKVNKVLIEYALITPSQLEINLLREKVVRQYADYVIR